MSDQQRQHRGAKPEWKEGVRFTEAGLTAVISVTQGFRPRYSVQVGRIRDDGSFVPYIPIQSEGSFQIKTTPIAKTLATLGEKVEEWISTELALRLDERIQKEEKQANFGNSNARQTGKTAKNRAKKLGRAA